jgi:hypothetical protein
MMTGDEPALSDPHPPSASAPGLSHVWKAYREYWQSVREAIEAEKLAKRQRLYPEHFRPRIMPGRGQSQSEPLPPLEPAPLTWGLALAWRQAQERIEDRRSCRVGDRVFARSDQGWFMERSRGGSTQLEWACGSDYWYSNLRLFVRLGGIIYLGWPADGE